MAEEQNRQRQGFLDTTVSVASTAVSSASSFNEASFSNEGGWDNAMAKGHESASKDGFSLEIGGEEAGAAPPPPITAAKRPHL